MIAVAANCFDTDATQKRVSGVTGAFGSRLVLPTADCASTSPFCVIITTPSKPLWRITASAIVCKAPASVGACVVASVTGSAFSADLPQAVRQHSKTAASRQQQRCDFFHGQHSLKKTKREVKSPLSHKYSITDYPIFVKVPIGTFGGCAGGRFRRLCRWALSAALDSWMVR